MDRLDPNEVASIEVMKGANEGMVTCRPVGSVFVATLKKLRDVRLQLIDEKDSTVLSNATVRLTVNGQTASFPANEKGEVAFPGLVTKQAVDAVITNVGYVTKESQFSFDSSGQTIIVRLQRHVSQMQAVVITNPSTIRCRFPVRIFSNSVTSKKGVSKQETDHGFLLYPNPTTANGKMTILPTKAVSGHYRVLTISGQILHTGILNHGSKQPIIISTFNWSAGTYFIQLQDAASGKTYTQKFFLQ